MIPEGLDIQPKNDVSEEPESSEPTTFHPHEELAKIRKLSPDESLLSESEKRLMQGYRLEKFKRELESQKIGVAKTINELRTIIEADPNVSSEVLFSKIFEASDRYKMTSDQTRRFHNAAVEYQKRHSAVEKYRALYPDDAELFKVCFGREPKGKIEVDKGSMTLLFRCYDISDYAFIFNNVGKVAGDRKDVGEPEIKAASYSGGFALYNVDIRELKDTVVVESAHIPLGYKFEENGETIKMLDINEDLDLSFLSLRKDIKIESDEGSSWIIRLLEPDDSGVPCRIKIVRMNKQSQSINCDLIRVNDPESEDSFVGGRLRSIAGLERKDIDYSTETLNLGQGVVKIEIDFYGIRIVNQSDHVLTINAVETTYFQTFGKDTTGRIKIHEIEHQFNKLFLPSNNYLKIRDVIEGVLKKADSPEEALDLVIHDVIRQERTKLVDAAARDEILAHYKDGKNPKEVLDVVGDNKLYDYKNQDYAKTAIEHLTSSLLLGRWEPYIRGAIAEFFENGKIAGPLLESLKINRKNVNKQVDSVFGQEYRKDLKNWVDSISVLEGKDYTRDEIVSLLYQEPVDSWSNLARRMSSK